MKSLKSNFFVKAARGYVIFFYLFFPLMVVGKYILLLTGSTLNSQQSNTVLLNVDLLDLFGNEKFITEINFNSVVLWLFILVVNAIMVAGIYYGLIKLNKFLKNVYEDKPFIQENGKHLKTIGILVMVLSTLIYVTKYVSEHFYRLPVSENYVSVRIIEFLLNALLNFNLVIGLVVFVIGEVIVRAAEIKEEQDLTV